MLLLVPASAVRSGLKGRSYARHMIHHVSNCHLILIARWPDRDGGEKPIIFDELAKILGDGRKRAFIACAGHAAQAQTADPAGAIRSAVGAVAC
jgi:hypothetical protein